ncbi:YcaO-like family protein [Sedimentitalea todarodis]|uniref:YcaO-like family protein n=1 Tax=Sedimentitalea todarodis TaxID=1631240 RepID=A0ABU3VDH1_9RHOB|nr:YcaO-like family protein [Sedimentitalea todarodis]MDU9004220.1 YcaO-like family protein [Sedimentitalea todarodis]
MNYCELIDHFDLISVTREGDPCHFAFCVPNQRAYARWPDFPRAARPDSGRAAAGRGVDAAQCEASALGEAIELACTCEWGDEALIMATLDELGSAAVSPDALNGFSSRQLAERETWNVSPFAALDWRPRPLDASRPTQWLSATRTSGETCLVPADFVLVGRREPGDQDAVSIATTSGCASGATPESAKQRALLELIERDAVGQWWYQHIPRPDSPLGSLDLPATVSRYLEERARQTMVLDLTTELGVPVMAALSCRPDGKALALGFGCDLSRARAGCSAIVEMFQTEIGLGQRAQRDDPLLGIWMREATRDNLAILGAAMTPPPQQPVDLNDVVARLARHGKNCAFVDLSRADFGKHVFRAIVPEMWSDKPRFAGFERSGLTAPRNSLPLLV